jgi:PIN like domain
MANVFIDANVYLAFYDEKYASLRALLRPLRSVRRELFITEQIVNEVDRRKLYVFLDYTKRFDNKFSLNLPLQSPQREEGRQLS